MNNKTGYKTTEFALVVITSLGALIASLADQLTPRYAALASSVSVGLYAISRGIAKLNVPPANPPGKRVA